MAISHRPPTHARLANHLTCGDLDDLAARRSLVWHWLTTENSDEPGALIRRTVWQQARPKGDRCGEHATTLIVVHVAQRANEFFTGWARPGQLKPGDHEVGRCESNTGDRAVWVCPGGLHAVGERTHCRVPWHTDRHSLTLRVYTFQRTTGLGDNRGVSDASSVDALEVYALLL